MNTNIGVILFLVFVIIAGAITAVAILVTQAKKKKDELPKSGIFDLPPGTGIYKEPTGSAAPLSPDTEPIVYYPEESKIIKSRKDQKTEPDSDVAVVYESLKKDKVRICGDCGCEYDSTTRICEICGRNLRRR